MKLPIFLIFSILIFTACQNSSQNGNTTSTNQPQAQPASPQEQLPALPMEIKQKLFNECAAVDYIFYDEPFTMSLVEKPAIQFVVNHIGDAAVQLNPACKPNGHISYQVNGDIFIESDFYYTNGCIYFVFLQKQQKVYASNMTQEGLNYINNQIQEAAKMRQQMQSGAQ